MACLPSEEPSRSLVPVTDLSPWRERVSHSSERQGLTKARDGDGTAGDDSIFPALVSHVDPLPRPPASRHGKES